jgi:hypothetical protein
MRFDDDHLGSSWTMLWIWQEAETEVRLPLAALSFDAEEMIFNQKASVE